MLANAFAGEDGGIEAAYERAAAAIADVRERLAGPVPESAGQTTEAPQFGSNMSREQFEANVARIVEYVHAGDAFQVVPSQRFSAEVEVEAFSIYRGLRTVNPSPYMYFLDFGDFEIAGASPEPLVKVTGRRVETRPIAGTYPRGADEEEDRKAAEQLLADPKERAEHVMLVDLGRNDLGRVSEFGSVEVEELMVVETYSHVLHIVSQVAGRLREGVDAMDVLRSCCPPGPSPARPRSARWRSSTSSNRTSAAPTAERSAISLTAAISTPRSTSAASWSRTGSSTCRPAAAPSPMPSRTTSSRSPSTRRRRSSARSSWRRSSRIGPDRSPHERSRMKVLVIDNYDSFTYNLVQYLGELGAEPDVVRNDRATVAELLERKPDRLVVSPGPCTPAEAGISIEAMRAFPEAGVPSLGVCLGHQSMVEAFGGKVVRGEPIHGKEAEIQHDGSSIYAGLPSPLVAGRYHSLVADPQLPPELEQISSYEGVVMGVRHRELPAEGVQFHPESVLTPDGKQMLGTFLESGIDSATS